VIEKSLAGDLLSNLVRLALIFGGLPSILVRW